MSMMNTNEIMKYIPHRYPFLLVDSVVSYIPNQSIVAIKNVTINEQFFVGHFPVRPVMPGVLIIEALAQAAGILLVKTLGFAENHSEVFFLAGIDNARFKRVVEPGDQLILQAEVTKNRRDLWKFQVTALVGEELACSAEIMVIRGVGE